MDRDYYELLKDGKLEEALAVSRKHLTSHDDVEIHHYFNHAMVAYELGRIGEAAWAMAEAKDILPGCPVVRLILGDFLLRLGKYREGFAEREWRFTMPLPDSPRPGIPIWGEIMPRIRMRYKKPLWDGSDLAGKTVLVFNEAGFGDMIQKIRYVGRLYDNANAKHVIVEVKEDLYRLFKESLPRCEIIKAQDRIESFMSTFIMTNRSYDAALPPHDFVVSSDSFAHFFDPDLANVEPMKQYLTPEKTHRGAAEKVRASEKKFKVGICWAGNPRDDADSHRSCHLKHFKHLQHPDVQLFSLQKGKLTRRWPSGTQVIDVDLSEGVESADLIDLKDDLGDFNDTAEAILGLDLVITVDTSVAHLAGALGRPVWLLKSQRDHEWRWALQWYASMRVKRQKTLNGWDELLREIAADLTTTNFVVDSV